MRTPYDHTPLGEALRIADERGMSPRDLLHAWGYGRTDHYGCGGGSSGDRFSALLVYCLRQAYAD